MLSSGKTNMHRQQEGDRARVQENRGSFSISAAITYNQKVAQNQEKPFSYGRNALTKQSPVSMTHLLACSSGGCIRLAGYK